MPRSRRNDANDVNDANDANDVRSPTVRRVRTDGDGRLSGVMSFMSTAKPSLIAARVVLLMVVDRRFGSELMLANVDVASRAIELFG
ncbi:hypothetical protein [Burkholderia stagnalis]|uniref:hypothetical protein n=1 Tax=Burkholderia stagnalis TaxID=1503054 RepID=UPI0012D894C6|nr:hypothetical protein [Burkholderia stagnalis]